MSTWAINSNTLTDIANAVRSKRGTSLPIRVDSLADEIELIEGDGLLRDKLIIPDKYNTGCRGELKKFDVSADTSGIGWRDNTTKIDFNSSNSVKNLQDNQVIVFENYDFTDYPAFDFYLANQYTSEKSYYKDNLKFVFKNCLFLTVAQSYAFPEATNISLEFYDCSFSKITMNKAIVDRCLIGNRTYYKSIIPNYDPGADGGTILGGHVNLRNSYIMDIEVETETQSSAHLDGIQMHLAGTDVHIHNCRFECFDMPYQYSSGNWSYSLFFESSCPNSSLNYCMFHGGGYYNVSLLKAENQNFANNLITRNTDYNTPCYPNEDRYQMTDEWADYIDTLLVSSVWVEDNKIKICYSNDLNSERTLKIVTDTNVTTTETVPACPTRSGATSQTVSKWSDLPFDLIKEIDASGVHNINIYDGNTLIRTFTVDTAGSVADTGAKSITQNGTYSASDDNLDGYSEVTVDVSSSSVLGAKSITQNGTYDPALDNLDGYSSVTVNLPTTVVSPQYLKTPLEFDYSNGYVDNSGKWTYQYPSNNRLDIYAIENGKQYRLSLGANVSNRARGCLTTTDIRTVSSGGTVQGTFIGAAGGFSSGWSGTFTASFDGYLVFQKSNDGTSGIYSYLQCIDDMISSTPSGVKIIQHNGEGIDVANYSQVDVSVMSGEGTLSVTQNGLVNVGMYAYANVNVQPSDTITISENGTYDVSQYATALVSVSGAGFDYLTILDVPVSQNTTDLVVDYDNTREVQTVLCYNTDATESQDHTMLSLWWMVNPLSGDPMKYMTHINYNATSVDRGVWGNVTIDSTTGKITLTCRGEGYPWRANRTYRVMIMYKESNS